MLLATSLNANVTQSAVDLTTLSQEEQQVVLQQLIGQLNEEERAELKAALAENDNDMMKKLKDNKALVIGGTVVLVGGGALAACYVLKKGPFAPGVDYLTMDDAKLGALESDDAVTAANTAFDAAVKAKKEDAKFKTFDSNVKLKAALEQATEFAKISGVSDGKVKITGDSGDVEVTEQAFKDWKALKDEIAKLEAKKAKVKKKA